MFSQFEKNKFGNFHQAPLVCTVTFYQDMAHYTPTFKWHGDSRKDLENSILSGIWENIKNDIDILYDTKNGITARFYKPKIKTKKIKIQNVNVHIILN